MFRLGGYQQGPTQPRPTALLAYQASQAPWPLLCPSPSSWAATVVAEGLTWRHPNFVMKRTGAAVVVAAVHRQMQYRHSVAYCRPRLAELAAPGEEERMPTRPPLRSMSHV